MIVDAGGVVPSAHAAAGPLQTAIGRLRLLACPTIVVSAPQSSRAGAAAGSGAIAASLSAPRETSAADFLAAFDVVANEARLADLLDSIARSPLAAMALVQLLRLGERLDVYEALTAESFVYSTLQSGPEFAAWLATRAAPTPGAESARSVVASHRDGARLEITLDRPERRNAYSAEMRDALAAALEVAVADDSVAQVVLRANGPSFCAGGDLTEFGTLPDCATAHAIRSTRSVARLLASCASRCRVEVHGACVGAGVELPAFASRVVARSDAFFQLPEISMGLVPGAGGTASIPRRIGRQKTAYLALSGARIDAATALAWGLVDELV